MEFATAHNLKVAGSNPAPATKSPRIIKCLRVALRGGACVCAYRGSTVEARGGGILRSLIVSSYRYRPVKPLWRSDGRVSYAAAAAQRQGRSSSIRLIL